MTAPFADPVLVEVFPEPGERVRFVTTYHGVSSRKETTFESLREALARQLCLIAKTNQGVLGAVVFNAGTPDLDPLHFFVATDVRLRDADDEDEATEVEVSAAMEESWEKQRREWVKKNKLSRRPVQRAEPVAVGSSAAPLIKEYDDDPEPTVPAAPEGASVTLTPIDPVGAPQVYTHEDLESAGPYLEQKDPAFSAPIENGRTDFFERQDEEAPSAPVQSQPPAWAGRRVSALPSLMDQDKHPQHAQDGWRSSLNALGLRLPPGRDELHRRELIDSILAGWDGPRIAMLLNEKGSGGKTPWALLLAAALQRHARGRVVVRDGNPTGNAHERAEYVAPLGAHQDGSPLNDRDLARYFLEHGELGTELSRFLHLHTTDKFGLLSHHVPSDDQDQLVAEEVDASLDALSADHVALINDSGNNPYERRDVAVLRRADQLIFPFLTYPDRENGARKTAERLEDWADREGGERYGWQLRNGIAVVNIAEDSREHRRRAENYAERWRGVVREVKVVPFDPHMASHNLRYDDLRLPTRTAVLEVAAAVAEGFRGGELTA
jgi:hypothetical protein